MTFQGVVARGPMGPLQPVCAPRGKIEGFGPRMRAVSVLLLSLVVVADLSAQSPATPHRGRVAGRVADANGKPLGSAVIRLTGPITRETYATSDGRFAIAGVPLGTYELTAVLDGFAPSRRRLEVTIDQTAEVQFVLWIHAAERTVVTAGKAGAIDVQATPAAISVLRGDTLERLQSQIGRAHV